MSEEVMDNVNELDHVVADEPEPVEEYYQSKELPEEDTTADVLTVLDSKTELRGADDMDVEKRFMYLDVGEIIVPEASNVRPTTSQEESESDAELAKSINDEGQIEPVIVMEKVLDGGGIEYHLIAGRRRVKAIASLPVPRQVEAIVVNERDGETVYREALMENIMREEINAIDMLENIKRLRERPEYKGAKNTPKVAKYFRVSPAKVHTYEQLESLDANTKEKVRTGEISREGAFLLVGRVNAPEVVKRAKEIQQVEDSKRPVRAKVVEGKVEVKARPVKARAIKKAIRETDSSTPMTRSRKEILDWFESMKGPVYGHADGAPHQFIDGVIAFSEGKIGDRALEKRFAVMVERAFKGTAPKSESRKGDSEVKVKVARKVRNKK